MPDDLTEQLRRYGEAVENHVLSDGAAENHRVYSDSDSGVGIPVGRRRPGVPLATAAALVLLIGGVLTAASRDGSRRAPLSTGGPEATAATTSEPAVVPGKVDRVTGTATWAGGRDGRAELRVGACPEDDNTLGCPSMRSTAVADDRSFTLVLPTAKSPKRWDVVAYVSTTTPACVFNCQFPEAPRNAVVGDTVTVATAPSPPHELALSVSARVIDVHVRDRNGDAFAGGGVQATDLRCRQSECPDDLVPTFVMASPETGAVRLVLDPDVTYELHGQATNTGWPDPALVNDGNTFWFSAELTLKGSELDDGFVFTIDGAPATS